MNWTFTKSTDAWVTFTMNTDIPPAQTNPKCLTMDTVDVVGPPDVKKIMSSSAGLELPFAPVPA